MTGQSPVALQCATSRDHASLRGFECRGSDKSKSGMVKLALTFCCAIKAILQMTCAYFKVRDTTMVHAERRGISHRQQEGLDAWQGQGLDEVLRPAPTLRPPLAGYAQTVLLSAACLLCILLSLRLSSMKLKVHCACQMPFSQQVV